MSGPVLADRVKDTTTGTGTGTLALAGSAPAGFRTFGSVLSDGDTCYYCVSSSGGSQWEVGLGTYAASGPTLARTTVLASSNSGSLVNFSAGTKDVFITLPGGIAQSLLPGGTTFSVSSLSLDVWGDADAITPQVDNTALTAWTDSAHSIAFSRAGAGGVTYRTGAGALGLNGHPGVTFTSASSGAMASASGGANLTGNFYVGVVLQTPGSGSFKNILSFGDNATHKRRSLALNPTGQKEEFWFIGESSDVTPGSTTLPLILRNTAYFLEAQFDGTNVKLWVNGILLTSTAVASFLSFASAVVKLGTNPAGGSEFLDGTIYSFFMRGSTLSTTEQNNLRLYVANRYQFFVSNTTGLYIPEITQTGTQQASPLTDVASYVVTAGGMVVGGQVLQYTGGTPDTTPYLNPSKFCVNGIFSAVATGSTEEHLLKSSGSSINVFAVWNTVGFSVGRYLNWSGLECAAFGFDPSTTGPSGGYEGFGSSFWEMSNFANVARGGCGGIIQTGQINGGTDGQYLRQSWVTNGDLYFHDLTRASATPGIILTLKPTGDLRGRTGVPTSSTTGHWRLPTCAGVPTGVPAGGEGSVVVDSSGHKLYVYLNGSWVAQT